MLIPRVRHTLFNAPVVAILAAAVLVASQIFGTDTYRQNQLILICIFSLLCSGLNLTFGSLESLPSAKLRSLLRAPIQARTSGCSSCTPLLVLWITGSAGCSPCTP